jgi:hypothetical protein
MGLADAAVTASAVDMAARINGNSLRIARGRRQVADVYLDRLHPKRSYLVVRQTDQATPRPASCGRKRRKPPVVERRRVCTLRIARAVALSERLGLRTDDPANPSELASKHRRLAGSLTRWA